MGEQFSINIPPTPRNSIRAGICQSQLSGQESAEYKWSQYGVISYYVFGVGCLLFIYYQFPLCICLISEKSTHAVSVLARSAVVELFTCVILSYHPPPHFPLLSLFPPSPLWSFAPSPSQTRMLTPVERIVRHVDCPACWQPCCVLVPLCQRNTAWKFEESASIWSEWDYFVSIPSWASVRALVRAHVVQIPCGIFVCLCTHLHFSIICYFSCFSCPDMS